MVGISVTGLTEDDKKYLKIRDKERLRQLESRRDDDTDRAPLLKKAEDKRTRRNERNLRSKKS